MSTFLNIITEFKIYRLITLFFALCAICITAFCQKSVELRKQRDQTRKDIEITERLVEETRNKKTESLSMLNLIRKKIELRNTYIKELTKEIEEIEKEQNENEKLITSLRNDLKNLKMEYARLIYQAYKSRKEQNILMFLLASESFNQAYKRTKYIQMYTEYKKKQKKLILAYEKVLVKKQDELEAQKNQKEALIKSRDSERIGLINEGNEKDSLIKKLKRKEGELLKELEEKRRNDELLSAEILRLIDAENKKKGTVGSFAALTPEEKVLSGEFEKNKGKLPWPTAQGIITGHFGIQKHPVFQNVDIRNDGIFIRTVENEDARAVFDGIVTKIFSFPGSNFTVLIKHGNYYSLYNNLIKVYVKEGEKVSTKQKIGKIFTDYDKNETVLHFQVWKDKERNNPEIWLSK